MPVTGLNPTINPVTSLSEDFSLTWNALCHLDSVHRPIMLERCGGGGVDCARRYGNMEVAYQAVIAARNAYESTRKATNWALDKAEEAARDAAIKVFDNARKDELIFLRNGTKSATVVLAYMIAHNFVSYTHA